MVTKRERIVSKRGRRDLKQQGHKNLTSLEAAAAICCAGVKRRVLLPVVLGSGTHDAVNREQLYEFSN